MPSRLPLEKVSKPVASAVVPLLVKLVSTPEAIASGSVQRKRKRLDSDLDVSRVPSFLLEADQFGPDVPEELAMPIISSGEVMRYFCSAIRKVGLLVEPGFQVNFRHVVIVAPRTKRGSIFGVGLGSL